jgi:hypothetical protein
MEGSMIGEAFVEISMNLLSVRTNLKAAIFSEDFGAFRHIYSGKIRNAMLFFMESVYKNTMQLDSDYKGCKQFKVCNYRIF